MQNIAITESNRFSIIVKSKREPNYKALLNWEQWFNQRGIPAAIVKTSSGYALYREGLIEVDIKD